MHIAHARSSLFSSQHNSVSSSRENIVWKSPQDPYLRRRVSNNYLYLYPQESAKLQEPSLLSLFSKLHNDVHNHVHVQVISDGQGVYYVYLYIAIMLLYPAFTQSNFQKSGYCQNTLLSCRLVDRNLKTHYSKYIVSNWMNCVCND